MVVRRRQRPLPMRGRSFAEKDVITGRKGETLQTSVAFRRVVAQGLREGGTVEIKAGRSRLTVRPAAGVPSSFDFQTRVAGGFPGAFRNITNVGVSDLFSAFSQGRVFIQRTPAGFRLRI